MCEVVIVYLYGTGTFIVTSQLQGTLTPALTAGDHWDAYLGLRLTTLVLYCTLTCRPKLEEGLWMSILFTTIFTALSRYFRSLASPNFEKILSQNLTFLSRIIFVNLPIFLYFEMVQVGHYHHKSFQYHYGPGAHSRQAYHTSCLLVDLHSV